jgi:hypothetical protein
MSMVFGLKQSGSWGGSPRCPERPPEGPGSPRAPGGIALAQPPALPRVPEGCISLIAGLLLAVRSATVLMVPSSHPAWTRAAQSGWLGSAARHPTPVGPVALTILRPACGRQGARPPGAGLRRRPVASPTQRVHSRRDCGKIAFEIPIRIRQEVT